MQLGVRVRNVPSPRPQRQVPRRKNTNSDDMSNDVMKKAQSLPSVLSNNNNSPRQVPPRRHDIRSTNLKNMDEFQHRLNRAASPGNRKKRVPPRREDVESTRIRNSVLLSRLKNNKSCPSLRLNV